MTKRLIVGVLVAIVLIAVGAVVWRIVSKDTSENTITTAMTTQQPAVSNLEPSAAIVQSAKYTTYSAADVANDKNTKLLFFHAPWCPQCRALDSDITKNIANETGVSIYKVDYDSNQSLRQKYGVTLQTTVVKIDDSGNLVEKYVAYNEPTFANVKANLLP